VATAPYDVELHEMELCAERSTPRRTDSTPMEQGSHPAEEEEVEEVEDYLEQHQTTQDEAGGKKCRVDQDSTPGKAVVAMTH